MRGHVPITALTDYGLDLSADSDAYNSVGGFVFGELGRLPKRGDMVDTNGYSLRVESVRQNRIEAVRIRDHQPQTREQPGLAGDGGSEDGDGGLEGEGDETEGGHRDDAVDRDEAAENA